MKTYLGPEYDKINTIWKRDEKGAIILGAYATPELDMLQHVNFDWTEKVDGTNIRIHWDGQELSMNGRTNNAQIPMPLVGWIEEHVKPEAMADISDGEITLYGEGYGGKIQKGGLYRPDESFVVFDIQIGGWYLKRADMIEVAGNLGLEVVHLVEIDTMERISEMVRNHELSSLWGEAKMEGLVGRPHVELRDRKGHRILAKIKKRDFRDG